MPSGPTRPKVSGPSPIGRGCQVASLDPAHLDHRVARPVPRLTGVRASGRPEHAQPQPSPRPAAWSSTPSAPPPSGRDQPLTRFVAMVPTFRGINRASDCPCLRRIPRVSGSWRSWWLPMAAREVGDPSLATGCRPTRPNVPQNRGGCRSTRVGRPTHRPGPASRPGPPPRWPAHADRVTIASAVGTAAGSRTVPVRTLTCSA